MIDYRKLAQKIFNPQTRQPHAFHWLTNKATAPIQSQETKMTNTTPEAVDWDDIPDTPEQRDD